MRYDYLPFSFIITGQVHIGDRFDGHVPTKGIFANIALVIDGTDCPIDCPSLSKEERLRYYCGREKDNQYSKYNLKYTIGVQISTGKICVVIGPDRGSVADITQLQDSELIAFLISSNPLEIVLADKGYQGVSSCLTPFKANRGHNRAPEEEAYNEVLASVRQIVECTLHRVKIFGVLGGRGRFHKNKDNHRAAFNVACQVTNISLEREPLWQHVNWYVART